MSNECASIPSYLKLILYPKFKIFLLHSGMISTEVYSHMQHTKMKITISEYAFTLPYSGCR